MIPRHDGSFADGRKYTGVGEFISVSDQRVRLRTTIAVETLRATDLEAVMGEQILRVRRLAFA
jgi:hypothetical protein